MDESICLLIRFAAFTDLGLFWRSPLLMHCESRITGVAKFLVKALQVQNEIFAVADDNIEELMNEMIRELFVWQ